MSKKRRRNGLNRREAMKHSLMGAAGLALMNQQRALAAPKPAKAKSVIQIWMWGGPSHLDTFDPKPGAGYDYCGPYDKPIATNADGIQICAAGALRGLKDTMVPMFINILSYLVIGLSVGYYLTFNKAMGPAGMWIGMIVGLSFGAVLLLGRFLFKSRKLILVGESAE